MSKKLIYWLALTALVAGGSFVLANTYDSNGRLLISCRNADGTKCGGAGGAGTVTSVATGAGLTGGTITTTGTLNLANVAATSHQWFDSVVSNQLHKSQPAFSDISGTALVTQGGTGVATLGANGVMIGQGTAPVHVSSAGTAGFVFTSNGAGVDPTFQVASGGLPSGGITGQVLNAVTANPAVWGSVVIGPDAIGGSGGNGTDVTIQAGQADGSGNDGIIQLNAGCNNTCIGIVVGDVNGVFAGTIQGANAATGSNDNGKTLIVSGGNADGTGQGGNLNLFAGVSGATGSFGGNIRVQAANQFGTGDAGTVTINSGTSSDGAGGFTSITAGNAGGAANDGGTVSVAAGNGSGTGNGGGQTFTAGNGGSTSGVGGTFSFRAGNSANAAGGAISFTAGTGVGTSHDGGAISVNGGDADTGDGGAVTISGGHVFSSGITGGVTLSTRDQANPSSGTGTITLLTGDAQDATDTVGSINLTTGAGGVATGGGTANISIIAGSSQGNNTTAGGNIRIRSGGGSTGTNSDGGDIAIDVGTQDGTGASGDVLMENFNGGSGSIHLMFRGQVPTVASGTGDCGTSPAIAGNDIVGTVTVGTSINGSQCTVTFSHKWHNKPNNADVIPNCIAQNETHAAFLRTASVTATAMVLTGTLLAGDVLNYHCLGQE